MWQQQLTVLKSFVKTLWNLIHCLSAYCTELAKYTGKKATIHQLTTMLATSKNVLFRGYNHLLTTGADDLSL